MSLIRTFDEYEKRIAELEGELVDVRNQREDNAAVFMIGRRHQITGPESNCSCPSCELHLVYRQQLKVAIEALRFVANREGGIYDRTCMAEQALRRILTETQASE